MAIFTKILFVFSNLVYLSNATPPTLDGRIIGGTNASILDFPYQVSLRKNGQHICGGSVFHNSYILTAAHCVFNGIASQFSIRAGSNDITKEGKRVQVCAISVHDSYNRDTMDNDVAILKLCSSLIFTEKILPIALPEYGEEVKQGTPALVTGWGYEKESGSVSTILKKVEIPIVSTTTCKVSYKSTEVTDNMICAGLLGIGGKDACQGDSGGPLRANGKLTGIVSWGYGCAQPKFPGVYTKVSKYRNWIKTVTSY